MDYFFKKMTFAETATLAEAIDCCLAGSKKVSFCVSKDNKLLGILTQGDILRILRNGTLLDSPALEFINRAPTTAPENVSVHDAKKILSKRIQFVPRIDSEGHLIGYVDLSSSDYDFINIRNKSVLILGLGYVGLTLGLTLADTGFFVKGCDINDNLLKILQQKKIPFFEAGLQEKIDTHIGKRLQLTSSLEDSIFDIFIITVGTPIDPDNKTPQTGHIQKAAESIGKVLSKDNLVILRSTVVVGTTRSVVIPTLEKISGLKAGEDFYVAYCPERTAEGKALEELKYLPQIIGGLDEKSNELASRLFNEYTHTIVNVQSLEAAELCKLLDNVYRDVKFAFANQVAAVTEKLDLDFHSLIDSVNLNYKRNDIPKPSPGVGGPCLTKDTYILRKTFEDAGLHASLLSAARTINEDGPRRIIARSEKLLNSIDKTLGNSKIFIVGFAFKGAPETSDLRDSTTLWFVEELKKYTNTFFGYDAVAYPDEMKQHGVEVVSLEEGFAGADAVFIMNNHLSYLNWDLKKLLPSLNAPALFFDSWGMFSQGKIHEYPGILYAAIGVGTFSKGKLLLDESA